MTPDLERWKQLIAKGKKWGGTIPVAEFSAAVSEVERLQKEMDEDPWPPVQWRGENEKGEVVSGTNYTRRSSPFEGAPSDTCPSCGEPAHPGIDCGAAFGREPRVMVIDVSQPGTMELYTDRPPNHDTQTPALASPATRGKRPDRAGAYNQFFKAQRAQGKTKPEILQAWKQQKGQG